VTDYRLIDAKPWHCGQIVRALYAEQHAATVAMGTNNAHREMRLCFDASCIRKAWLIDDRLAALGGISGMTLASSGYIWLAVTKEARRHRFAFVREARRQLAAVMTIKREITAAIIQGDKVGYRFALFLGFHFARDKSAKMPGTLLMKYDWREAA
jgi:hypothetical protein